MNPKLLNYPKTKTLINSEFLILSKLLSKQKKSLYKILFYKDLLYILEWSEAGLNRRHMDFQSIALPAELPDHFMN